MIHRQGYTGQDPHICRCFLCEKEFKVKEIKYYLFIDDELLEEGLEICLECAKIDDIKEIALKIFKRVKRLKDEASDFEVAAWSTIQSLNEGNTQVCDEGMVDLETEDVG